MALRVRRTNAPKQKNYQGYKRYLREDFRYICVYCEIHENENGGPRFFTVEHFRPKSRFPALRTDYANLLYACSVCNSFKGNDWPTDDPLGDGKGYLDPCEHDYDQHFTYSADFLVEGKTPVARYMIASMHLNRPMMQKIRQSRREEEELHQQFVELFERNLALLAAALQDAELPVGERRQLEHELERLRRQYERRHEAWNRRWQPLFGMDDYR